MSHYTPMHARDGQRRDALRALARDTWTRLSGVAAQLRLNPADGMWGLLRWWDWPAPARRLVLRHWHRKALATSQAPDTPGAVAAGTGTSAGDSPPPAAALPATPSGESAATLPRPVPAPPGAGPGQPLPWVITQPPPGSPLGYQPVPRYRGDYRPTQPFRAIGPVPVSVVRPYYPAAEARRDSTARWGA